MPQNWNIPGVGGDLPQIANMLYQRQQDQQRNALAQMAQQEQMAFRQAQMQQDAAQFAQQGQWRQEEQARADERFARQRSDEVKGRRQDYRMRAEENERTRAFQASQNAADRAAAERRAAMGNQPKPPKPLPGFALRIVDDAKQAIAATGESSMLVNSAINKLEKGEVNLGLFANAKSRARNYAGVSDDNSRAYADILQTFEKLRANYLLLAKGVQTEGDAIRAWNAEIGESVENDNKLALQQLKKARALTERSVQMQNDRIGTVYSNFGQEPPAAGGGENDPLGIR